MCTLINIKHGAIALLGNSSEINCQIKNIEHTIELYIQYGNRPMQPIQIQIDSTRWEERSNEMYYINLLREQERAIIYDQNKQLIPR